MHIRILLKNITQHCRSLGGSRYRSQLCDFQFILHARSYSDRAYFHQVGNEPLLYHNLGQRLQRAVTQFGKRPALIACTENKRLTFEDAKAQAEILAVQLQALGLEKGDHLGIWATNSPQWYVSFLAGALAGFPVVCINPALQPQEIEYALQKAKVKVLITMAECGKQNFYDILKAVLPNTKSAATRINEPALPELQHVIMHAEQPLPEFLNFEQLLNTTTSSQHVMNVNQQVRAISPESVCNVQFTSGTTGQPKAALLTHFNCVNEARQFGTYLKLNESTKHICVTVPFFHVFGLVVLMSALEYGATMVLPSHTFNGVAALEAVEKEGCNIILGTPTMFVDMLEKQRKLQKAVHSLELGVVGGAACSPEVFAQTKNVFELRDMIIAYGLSEGTAAVFAQDGTEMQDNAMKTVGRLFEHCEAKIINEQGETMAYGEVGELCVRGFLVMKGYFEDAQRTKEVLDEQRWLRTGDKFILQPNGIGSIVGRKKDIIIRGGENIFPKEIEDFLDTHEDILETQIIGVPDKRMGEEVCAYLRLKPGAKALTAEDIKRFSKGRIAHFKVPRYVRLIDEFPKTNSGKIQKFKLKEMFKFD